MTPLESFHQDWLHWSRFIPWQKDFPRSRSIQGLKDSPGVHLSWDESRAEWLQDRMTLGQNDSMTEWLPWSRSTRTDSPTVVLSHDRRTPLESFHKHWMTPLESFYPRTEWLPWSRSTPGQNVSPGVVPSQDRMTPLVSFHQDWLPWSRSIPWQKESPGVVPSQDWRNPLESFHPRTKGLP